MSKPATTHLCGPSFITCLVLAIVFSFCSRPTFAQTSAPAPSFQETVTYINNRIQEAQCVGAHRSITNDGVISFSADEKGNVTLGYYHWVDAITSRFNIETVNLREVNLGVDYADGSDGSALALSCSDQSNCINRGIYGRVTEIDWCVLDAARVVRALEHLKMLAGGPAASTDPFADH